MIRLSMFCDVSVGDLTLTLVDEPIGLEFCLNKSVYNLKHNIRICNSVFCFYASVFFDLALIASNCYCICVVRIELKHFLFSCE